MNDQEKYLAYAAIDDVCKDSCARKIVKWVMECELNGWDSIRPSNKWLANKFGWSEQILRNKIYEAKKSQFITTTGRNKSRTFELNIQFLKGEMAKVLARKPMKRNIDFSDIMALENNSGYKLGDNLGYKLGYKLGYAQQEANSNSNSNSNNILTPESSSPSAPQHEKTNVNTNHDVLTSQQLRASDLSARHCGQHQNCKGCNTNVRAIHDDFEKFWNQYPLKQNKSKARIAWVKIKDKPEIDVILLAVQKQKNWQQWKDGFIPHATTWLNGRRWEDEERKPLEAPRMYA